MEEKIKEWKNLMTSDVPIEKGSLVGIKINSEYFIDGDDIPAGLYAKELEVSDSANGIVEIRYFDANDEEKRESLWESDIEKHPTTVLDKFIINLNSAVRLGKYYQERINDREFGEIDFPIPSSILSRKSPKYEPKNEFETEMFWVFLKLISEQNIGISIASIDKEQVTEAGEKHKHVVVKVVYNRNTDLDKLKKLSFKLREQSIEKVLDGAKEK